MSEQISLNQSGDYSKGRVSTSGVNQYLDVFVYFADSDKNYVDVSGIAAQITRSSDGSVVLSGTPVRIATGYYQYSFLAVGFQAGSYKIRFSGTYGTTLLVVEGSLILGEIDNLEAYINSVRYNLYEIDDTWLKYQLDEPVKYWTDEMIRRALQHSLMIINEHPPTISNWSFDSVPCPGILTSGATVECLLQRARFEDANTMNYSDAGKTLGMQRGQFYRQMAEEWNRMFRGTGGVLGGGILGFKMSFRPRSQGVGSQRLPYRVLRPLSFLPNCKNIFGA